MELQNWTLESRDVETGQDCYIFNNPNKPPFFMLDNDKFYNAKRIYIKNNNLLWVEGWRETAEKIKVHISSTPGEIKQTSIGYCSNFELHSLIAKYFASHDVENMQHKEKV